MQTPEPSRPTLALAPAGLALATAGLYVAGADDAPGAAVLGTLLMAAAAVVVVQAFRPRLPGHTARLALAAGVVMAAVAGAVTREVRLVTPLFAQAHAVPSVVAQAPAPEVVAAIDRARGVVRATMVQHDLPGVSVAVGLGDDRVWAEGFGWRDVATQTPVTPATRFAVGTAAAAIATAAAPLALADTGAEPAAAWSPEHIGEPEEDFPPFTLVRHVLLQPLGLAPLEPLPGDRATFYVPRTGGPSGRGRRLMAMRDLGCCEAGLTSYSTPSDLVRIGRAPGARTLHGELAGGTVVSLLVLRDDGLVVAVMSNLAHADTRDLAGRVAAACAAASP